MAHASIDGLLVGYDLIGEGRPWVLTPGGRFDRGTPGLRELAEALVESGNQVLIWDRPNTGESDVRFDGDSESAMQADVLAGLLSHLDLAPAVVAGGSGGSRVSLLAAARHPDLVAGLAIWWISGGPFGLLTIANHYCAGSIRAAWNDGMEAVAALPEWAEVIERNPSNRQRFLDQNPKVFIAALERWMTAYCPCGDEIVPGLADSAAAELTVPTLVLRSGASDPHHTRATSERLAEVLPNAQLIEPPWGDTEWLDRQAARAHGEGLFARWPLLAPLLQEWADKTLDGDR